MQKRSRDRGQHAEKPLKDLPTELQSLEADVQCCERALCDPLNELERLSKLRDILRRPGNDRLFAAADSQNFRQLCVGVLAVNPVDEQVVILLKRFERGFGLRAEYPVRAHLPEIVSQFGEPFLKLLYVIVRKPPAKVPLQHFGLADRHRRLYGFILALEHLPIGKRGLQVLPKGSDGLAQFEQRVNRNVREDRVHRVSDGEHDSPKRFESVLEPPDQVVPASEVFPLLQQFVSRFGAVVDDPAQDVAHAGPQLARFLEVADDVLPGVRPAGAERFLERVDQLAERLDLRRGVVRVLAELHDRFGLLLRIALRKDLLFRQIARKLLQGFEHDLGGQPSILKCFAEAAFLLDHLVDRDAVNARSFLQRVLEYLAAHARIDHRVPVHQADRARRERLRELIHRRRSLRGSRARNCGKVGNALDRGD